MCMYVLGILGSPSMKLPEYIYHRSLYCIIMKDNGGPISEWMMSKNWLTIFESECETTSSLLQSPSDNFRDNQYLNRVLRQEHNKGNT